jgi:predicted signal transduction protein with EAL and GGDEF domain
VQLALGLVLVLTTLQAARRSDSFGRYFWRLAGLSYALWSIAQGLATYEDAFQPSASIVWATHLLFTFWFLPLGMALFLDPDYEPKGFDWLLILDFVQVVLFWVTAYLFFFYLSAQSESETEIAHSVWAPYFVCYGMMVVAFLLRSWTAHAPLVRTLFGRIGFFLLFSIMIDALYYYGLGGQWPTGSWLDILWSMLLMIPLVTAARWNRVEAPKPAATPVQARGLVITQLFPLVYPVLVLVVSAGIARQRIILASVAVLVSFACSSARLLITQHRLLRAQGALREQASHDGLTGAWNHMAILDVARRELLRAERDGTDVGIIMADADRFKHINDTHGHAAGDFVLRRITAEISSVLRPYDSLGRYGGEEFLIVVPG